MDANARNKRMMDKWIDRHIHLDTQDVSKPSALFEKAFNDMWTLVNNLNEYMGGVINGFEEMPAPYRDGVEAFMEVNAKTKPGRDVNESTVIPFSKLCLGGKFSYIPSIHGHKTVYVKISNDRNGGCVAAWDEDNVSTGWIGQGIFSLNDTGCDIDIKVET